MLGRFPGQRMRLPINGIGWSLRRAIASSFFSFAALSPGARSPIGRC